MIVVVLVLEDRNHLARLVGVRAKRKINGLEQDGGEGSGKGEGDDRGHRGAQASGRSLRGGSRGCLASRASAPWRLVSLR